MPAWAKLRSVTVRLTQPTCSPVLVTAAGAQVLDVGHLGGGEEDEHGQRDDDDPDGLELTGQEGLGALLDGLGDVLHRRGALIGGQDTPHQKQGHHDGGHGTDQREVQPGLLATVQREDLVTPFSQEVGHR